MSVLDRLVNSSEPTEGGDSSGLKASYLLELPAEQRRVMRLLLRRAEMTLADLRQAIEAFPEGEKMTAEQLEQVIKVLLDQNWLIRTEVEQTVSYKANFHRRSETGLEKLAPKRKVSPVVRGVWDALESKDTVSENKKKE